MGKSTTPRLLLLLYVSKEETISDELSRHGIRLDVYIKDEEGTMYSIGIQVVNWDDLLRRIRFYQGTMNYLCHETPSLPALDTPSLWD